VVIVMIVQLDGVSLGREGWLGRGRARHLSWGRMSRNGSVDLLLRFCWMVATEFYLWYELMQTMRRRNLSGQITQFAPISGFCSIGRVGHPTLLRWALATIHSVSSALLLR
jgi:hypothetical protein